ncbi:MAG: hypothetical protein IH946_00760 [Bacteroidetes bacterium]|nr:hypothetical protein [Bacteroidota bacterium]
MKILFLASTILSISFMLNAQVRLTVVDPVLDEITIHNYGSSTENINSWWLCARFSYVQLSGITVQSGSLSLAAGADVTVSGFSLNNTSSDLGLYNSSSFTSTTAMQDFVQWGGGGIGRESVAVAKGIWVAGTFISGTGPYYYIGDGTENGVQFWSIFAPGPGWEGLDIEYACVSDTQYTITATLYRDCAGVAAPTAPYINVSSVNCSFDTTYILLTLQNVGGTEVSQLCNAEISNSTCNDSTDYPGTEKYIYQGTLFLADSDTCADFIITGLYADSGSANALCCRNTVVDNLVLAASQKQLVEATFDNKGGLCNSSPIFNGPPTPIICTEVAYKYNHGAVDPDGDSLVYSFFNALGDYSPGGDLSYVEPFTPFSPVSSNSVPQINAQTGEITFTANTIQNVVVEVKVEEYRTVNGSPKLVGTTSRDMQFIVRSCLNQQPVSDNGIENVSGGTKTSKLSISTCVGNSLSFDVIFTDPDTDNLTVTNTVNNDIPQASFSTTSPGTSVTGSFLWVPIESDEGYSTFSVSI